MVQLLAAGGHGSPPPVLPNGAGLGNRAIAAIVAQRSAGGVAVIQRLPADTNVGERVQHLRSAIKFETFLYRFVIDEGKASDALDNMTEDEGRQVKAEYQRLEKRNLGWIFSAVEQPIADGPPATNNLSMASRTKLLNLLAGTRSPEPPPAAEAPAQAPAQAPAPPAPAAATGPAAPAAAGAPAPGPVPTAAPAAKPAAPPDPEKMRKRRQRVLASSIRRAIEKKDAEAAISLIPATMEERREIDALYQSMYGKTAYMELFTKLPGKDGARAGALWYDEKDEADRYALEAGVEARDKAEKEAKALESSPLGSALGEAAKAKRQEGDKKLAAAVKKVANAGDLTTVAGKEASRKRLDDLVKAVERGEGRAMGGKYVGIRDDPVLKAIADGNEADEIGARLARADSIKDVSTAEIESALREVRAAAEDEADRQLASAKEGETVDADAMTKAIVDGYFARFKAAFNHAQKRRTFLEMMGGRGGDDEKVANLVGVDVDALHDKLGGRAEIDRNNALMNQKGQLDEVSELVFALASKPKDIDRVREILGTKTVTEIRKLRKQYWKRAGRSFEEDLVGTELEQKAAQFDNESRENLQDKQALLAGGRWDRDVAAKSAPTGDDPVARETYFLKAEGEFYFRRAGAIWKRVVDNRGTYARARDWSGNDEKAILDTAESDRWRALTTLNRALYGPVAGPSDRSGPDLAAARTAVEELRVMSRRMEHATRIYKEATKKSYEEFVDLVVNAASIAAGLGVTGIWITALRTTAATVGTKLVLKGGDYTADEFLSDLEGGMAGVAGDFAKLGMNKLVTPYVASKIMRLAGRVGMSDALRKQIADRIGPFALRQAEHTVGTAASNIAQGKSWKEGQGWVDRAKGEVIGQITTPINEHIENRRNAGKAGYGDESDGIPRPVDEEAGASPRASGANAGSAEGPSASGGGSTPDAPTPRAAGEDGDATPVAVPMALPEPAPARPRRKRGEPPPIPDAAKRRKPRSAPDELEQDVPRSPDDDQAGSRRDQEEPARAKGEEIHGPAEAHPPVNWDHQLVIQLGNATSHAEAHDLMVKMFGESPTREVGLYRNSETGEYIVIQGEERKVSLRPKPGDQEQRWKEILGAHSKVGRWELVAHTHPRGRPFPTGAPGDFGTIIREALNRKVARESEIVTATSDGGIAKTTFGYDPNHDAPFWIKPPGYEEPLRFPTLDKYNEFVGNPAPAAAWVPKGRVDWNNLADIKKAANATEPAEGPREPGDPADESQRHDKASGEAPTAAAPASPSAPAPSPAPETPDSGIDMSAIPPQTIPALTEFAKHYHLVIDIRPPGSHTRERLAGGAIAKPEAIKAKTINDADLLLGAPKDAVGLVGYFEPKLPQRPKSMGDADWKIVTDRHAQREREFHDLAPAMGELLANDTIRIKDGVVQAIDPKTPGDGPARYRDVAGDVDIYQIRKANGLPMTNADAERYASMLRSWGIAVEHGAHLRWTPDGKAETQIYYDVIKKHGPGKEPLIRIEAGDAPKVVDNTTPITPRPGRDFRFDATGDGEDGSQRTQTRGDHPAPQDEAPIVPMGAETGVGSVDPRAAKPLESANPATADLRAEPNRPASRSQGATFDRRPRSRYEFQKRVGEGINAGWIVKDLQTGTLHLFKMTGSARNVPRAKERGIEKEDYAARSAATEIAANALGVRTPKVELVSIGGAPGSLTEWWPTESLNGLLKRDPDTFQRVVSSPEFKKAQASIDALDYLVNNLDRNQNLGNYLIQLDPKGNFVSLAPIDHDLTFTSTGMRAELPDYTRGFPHEYPPQLALKLIELERDLPQFLDSIRPLVGEEALPGVERRLRAMIKDMQDKDRQKARTVGA